MQILAGVGGAAEIVIDYLVVAGGGGGGSRGHGGGGGAGGLRSSTGATGGGGSLESALSAIVGTNYSVSIGSGGSGGAGGSNNSGVNGGNSSFSTITSSGGGYGSGLSIGLFHPTYVKYQYAPIPGLSGGYTPDAITWPSTGQWTNPYGKFYNDDGLPIKPVINPLRQRTDPGSGISLSGWDTLGYKYAVEIDKTDGARSRENPTQIRFRRINSEFAMMDFNITLKVNDQWDLALDDFNDELSDEPNPSIYAPGTFASSVQRRGLWWLQHVRIRFDIDSGMVKATNVSSPVNTPNYHATKYDNGMGFRMWSDYNQWYNGNAVAHRGVSDAIGYADPFGYPGGSNAYADNFVQKTFNHNVWNWPAMMADYLNSNSRVIPTSLHNSGIISIPTSASTQYYREFGDVITTTIANNPYASYDRLIYVDVITDERPLGAEVPNIVTLSFTQTDGTSTTVLQLENEEGLAAVNGTAIIPAGSTYKITLTGYSDPFQGSLQVHTFQMGSTFPLDYHNHVSNTGTVFGLSSASGALLPFVQALRNRIDYDGTWDDIYDNADGMWGPTYLNIDRLMRQVWTTFGNGAFMKSKPLQWRVFPYNDPGTRGAGYEWEQGDTTIHNQLPLGSTDPGIENDGNNNGGYENSFYLDVIIPDGILHDPVGGFGSWFSGPDGLIKSTTKKVRDGLLESRDYRYVTISGQAMVNFQEITLGTSNAPTPPSPPKPPPMEV